MFGADPSKRKRTTLKTYIVRRKRHKFLVHKTKGSMSQGALQSISEHYCLKIFSATYFYQKLINKQIAVSQET
jgi:hypothetical protein